LYCFDPENIVIKLFFDPENIVIDPENIVIDPENIVIDCFKTHKQGL